METYKIVCLLLSFVMVVELIEVAPYRAPWFKDMSQYGSMENDNHGLQPRGQKKFCYCLREGDYGWAVQFCPPELCTQRCCSCKEAADGYQCCGRSLCPKRKKTTTTPRPTTTTPLPPPPPPPPSTPPPPPPLPPRPKGPRVSPYNACVCQKTRTNNGVTEHYYGECWGRECLYPCCNCNIRYHYNKVCCGQKICEKKGRGRFYVEGALCSCARKEGHYG